MKLSPDQDRALSAIAKWYENWTESTPFFYLGGYAGCGKTTIESYFTDTIEGPIVRGAFSGKAALRMQEVTGKQASTIHSIAYSLIDEGEEKEGERRQPKFALNTVDSPIKYCKLLVLDECSMINDEMGNDLLTFKKPILVLGDPGQLPPVKGSGFFTKRKPHFMLTEVHRQALDSPILRVATDIRNGKTIGRMNDPDCMIYPFAKDYDLEAEMLMADQILTGTNKVRESVNRQVRNLKGFNNPYPVLEDKLICLKNQRKINIFNGLLGTVRKVRHADEHMVQLDIETEIGIRSYLDIIPECFTDMDAVNDTPFSDRREFSEFDYGYCLTVHKAQGSQWDSVLLLDDSFLSWKKEARQQWLYTGVTRAAKKLVVLNRKP